MIKYFEELGKQIQKSWDAIDRQERHLGPIAKELIVRKPIHEHVAMEDVVEYTLFDKLENQGHKDFGQPPIIVYSGEDFHIEVLFWLEATTAIHQHGFAGLFCVLEGSSVHSEYTFKEEQYINQRLKFGQLELLKAEELKQGDSHIIKPADELIHGLFHLDYPSVSVVIRTNSDVQFNPQYSYFYPYIAYDGFYFSDTLNRRSRILQAMSSISHEQFRIWLQKSIDGTDLYNAFVILHDLLVSNSIDQSILLDVVKECSNHDQVLLQKISSCLINVLKSREIINLRDRITGKDHRYLLALLLNVPERALIFKMIQDKYKTNDPVCQIHHWIQEINNIKGINLNYTDLQLELIKMMLEGRHLSQIITDKKTLTSGSDQNDVESNIKEAYDFVMSKPIFEKLFVTEEKLSVV